MDLPTTLDSAIIEKLSKVYSPWPASNYSWCSRPMSQNSAWPFRANISHHTGLLYVKNHKAASSTAAGITLRIAHHVAQRKFAMTARCPNEYRHAYSIRKRHAWRSVEQSFLWTTIRHPATTALSAFFFFSVSRSGQIPTSERIINALQRYKSRQCHLLSTVEHTFPTMTNTTTGTRSTTKDSTTTVGTAVEWIDQYVTRPYNFIAVVERFSESLVVLKYLLHLEWSDLVVLPAKQSGTWFLRSTHCVPLIPPFTTPEVEEYIHTDFVQDNYDYMLYAVANRSLDRTIEALGRERVQEGVRYLNQLQQLAESECLEDARFPCSINGTDQLEASWESCYAEDCGCGYTCVDRVLA